MDPALASLFNINQTTKTIEYPSGATLNTLGIFNIQYSTYLTDYSSRTTARTYAF